MLLGLGRLNVRHLIQLRKATFYRHLLQSSDVGLLRHNMFLVFYSITMMIVYYKHYSFSFLFLFKGGSKCGFSTLLSCSGFIVSFCLHHVFLSEQIKMMKFDAIKSVWTAFENYVM